MLLFFDWVRALLLGISILILPGPVIAQEFQIPNFWDPQERFSIPNAKKLGNIRFITTTNFPPFSFVDDNKQIAGFNIDLARAVCSELGILGSCQIQALPWLEQEKAVTEQPGTVLISGLAVDSASRKKFLFTRPYIGLPARFIGLKSQPTSEPLYHNLSGRTIGVVANTAHEAFLIANFGKSGLRIFLNQSDALAALMKSEVNVVFTDALSASFWLHSKKSADCCTFVGGPYLAPEYFGRGLTMAVRPNDKELLNALNFALRSINDKGIFAELYLRYFPESLY